MPFWLEMALKVAILACALTLALAATAFLLLGTLGNGGATTVEPFSWTAELILLFLWGVIVALAWFGCRSIWRRIESWSDELKAQR